MDEPLDWSYLDSEDNVHVYSAFAKKAVTRIFNLFFRCTAERERISALVCPKRLYLSFFYCYHNEFNTYYNFIIILHQSKLDMFFF